MIRQAVRIATMGVVTVALTLLLGGPARAATSLAPAPDFTLTLLDGKTLTLADFRGKPVVLNFWWSQ
jgi:cytochrome oxidase Cu insertion factor (SCO1/SenC/PrrC family)